MIREIIEIEVALSVLRQTAEATSLPHNKEFSGIGSKSI